MVIMIFLVAWCDNNLKSNENKSDEIVMESENKSEIIIETEDDIEFYKIENSISNNFPIFEE